MGNSCLRRKPTEKKVLQMEPERVLKIYIKEVIHFLSTPIGVGHTTFKTVYPLRPSEDRIYTLNPYFLSI